MRVGVPAEIKDNENRIAMVPGGCAQIVKAGHDVLVQTDAGVGLEIDFRWASPPVGTSYF